MLLNNRRFCIWENRISDVEVKLVKKNKNSWNEKAKQNKKKQNIIYEGN